MPVQGIHINDNIWGLNQNNELYLKPNHFRYNSGPEAFTQDVSF